MKKLFTLIFALIMLLTCTCAFAEGEKTDFEAGEYNPDKHTVTPIQRGHFWYILLKDDTAEIIKYTGNDSKLLIPAKLDGVTVTSIGNSAFYRCDGLISVTIPDSVTFIGNSAFYRCNGLTSVTLPDSVTAIASRAFYSCDGLISVTIPDSVTFIGNSAFYGCDGLISITIPDSVTSIDISAFLSCDSLISVTIPDSVTFIGSNAFNKCPNLVLTVTPYSAAEATAKESSWRYVYAKVDVTAWTCPSCFNYNESAFCPDCGTARPAETQPVAEPECSGCGYRPEGDVPKFCPDCGTKF